MPLTEEQKRILKESRKSFKQFSGIDVDFISIASKLIEVPGINDRYSGGNKYNKAYTENYLKVLEDVIVPVVMEKIKKGLPTEGIGDEFEAHMKEIYDMLAPENINEGYQDEEENYGQMADDLYNESVEYSFRKNKFMLSEAFYKYQERAYKPENGTTVYSKNLNELSEHLSPYKMMNLENGNKKNLAEGLVAAVSENYMVVRDHYNSLGFFGKWCTREGWNYGGAMRDTRRILDACLKDSGIKKSASEMLHEYAEAHTLIGDDREKSYGDALNDFRIQINVNEEREEINADFLIQDEDNEPYIMDVKVPEE